jgi:hypothetical protein
VPKKHANHDEAGLNPASGTFNTKMFAAPQVVQKCGMAKIPILHLLNAYGIFFFT